MGNFESTAFIGIFYSYGTFCVFEIFCIFVNGFFWYFLFANILWLEFWDPNIFFYCMVLRWKGSVKEGKQVLKLSIPFEPFNYRARPVWAGSASSTLAVSNCFSKNGFSTCSQCISTSALLAVVVPKAKHFFQDASHWSKIRKFFLNVDCNLYFS